MMIVRGSDAEVIGDMLAQRAEAEHDAVNRMIYESYALVFRSARALLILETEADLEKHGLDPMTAEGYRVNPEEPA